jgi:hypothetical protein
MNIQNFNEMSHKEARNYVEKHGINELDKSGIFYHRFFNSGHLYPDFKEKLKIFVDHGIDLNQAICKRFNDKNIPIFQTLSDPDGKTASAIKALVECGADINLRNDDGRTPIMMASIHRSGGSRSSVVKALIKLGADLNCKDNKGKFATDLADAKALAILIKAGAAINIKSKNALMTAIDAGDLDSTVDLLSRGAKVNLDLHAIHNIPFFEAIAHNAPDLFKKGLSLKADDGSWARYHVNFRTAARHFLELLEFCDAPPTGQKSNACNEVELPESLRLGAWPPKTPEPTPQISVQLPPVMAPTFCFPPDVQAECEKICEIDAEGHPAGAVQSKFSEFIEKVKYNLHQIETADLQTESEKFLKNPIIQKPNNLNGSRIWRAKELLTHYRDMGANEYFVATIYNEEQRKIKTINRSNTKLNNFIDISIFVDTLCEFDLRIYSHEENLINKEEFIKYAVFIKKGLILTSRIENELDFKKIGLYRKEDLEDYLDIFEQVKFKGMWGPLKNIHYYILAYRIGASAATALQRIAGGGNVNALSCLTHLDSESLAPFMAQYVGLPEKSKHPLAWFRNFPDTAVNGLLKCSFDGDLNTRRNAQKALRLIARDGREQQIFDRAQALGEEAKAAALKFLGQDPSADFLPHKMPKLPSYFVASAYTAPVLSASREALPPHAVETLARMMLVSDCHVQTPAMQEVIAACDKQSLANFALEVFESWYKRSNPKDSLGFLYALSYLGDDHAANLLKKRYQSATGKTGERVIGVLKSMGTNTAITGLQVFARFNPTDELRNLAQEALKEVAQDRGLTPEQLEDLAVPDLGLDQSGKMILDFGPRHFVLTLDANLEAVLKDQDGNVHKTLPKAVKSDDASKAKAAAAQWKEFKAALKGQATDQKKRFEQAMILRRKWDGATFMDVVASHPMLANMVRSLVWVSSKSEASDTAFRIDANGRCIALDGTEFWLDDEAKVTLPHPVLMAGELEHWLQVFAENKITQPFPQLARKWFIEGSSTEKLIKDRDGTKVALGSLRGLKAKGWRFEEGGAGMVWSVHKFIGGAHASIDVEPGWSLSGFDYEDFGGDQTIKLEVSGNDPVAYSELVRDALAMPIVES